MRVRILQYMRKWCSNCWLLAYSYIGYESSIVSRSWYIYNASPLPTINIRKNVDIVSDLFNIASNILTRPLFLKIQLCWRVNVLYVPWSLVSQELIVGSIWKLAVVALWCLTISHCYDIQFQSRGTKDERKISLGSSSCKMYILTFES